MLQFRISINLFTQNHLTERLKLKQPTFSNKSLCHKIASLFGEIFYLFFRRNSNIFLTKKAIFGFHSATEQSQATQL